MDTQPAAIAVTNINGNPFMNRSLEELCVRLMAAQARLDSINNGTHRTASTLQPERLERHKVFASAEIAQIEQAIAVRQTIIADLITERLIVHCPDQLENARLVADNFGKVARATLENALGYVAQLAKSDGRYPDARCHLYPGTGNHPEHQADFQYDIYASAHQDSERLFTGGIHLFIVNGQAQWSDFLVINSKDIAGHL